MSRPDNAILVGADGRFFISAFFEPKTKACRAKWSPEYPDASPYTPDEAARTAARLRDAGFAVEVVTDYGMENESRS